MFAFVNKHKVFVIAFLLSMLILLLIRQAAHQRAVDTAQDEAQRILAMQSLNIANFSWLVNAAGDVIASNKKVALGSNVSMTSYFTAAMEGRLGRSTMANGQSSRFYIYASPVLSGKKLLGAIVVQLSLDFVENSLALIPEPIIAVKQDGQIFLSNHDNWRLNNEFGSNQKENQDDFLIDSNYQGKNFIRLANDFQVNGAKDFLYYKKHIHLFGWDLVVLKDYQRINERVNFVTMLTIIALMIIWFLAWLLMQRDKRLQKEEAQQREFAHQLERQVARRTEQLSTTNAQLEMEIEDRKIAENELKKAQNELIQAAKMASIGQISTALAHEYNQPIASIQFYAQNANTLIEKKALQEAKDNMDRITVLSGRMSRLTDTLRTFARKPAELQLIDVSSVIDEVMLLMKPLALNDHVDIMLLPPDDAVLVHAGHTRLVQVMANLVSNAIDAMKESTTKRVEISWDMDDKKARLIVRDTGPGIPKEQHDKIFDAFYTTKPSGKGLGLGLFIVVNLIKDFDGLLDLRTEPNYGSVFVLEIPLQDKIH